MGSVESCCGPRQRVQEAPPKDWLDSAALQPAAQEAQGHRREAVAKQQTERALEGMLRDPSRLSQTCL